MKIYTITTKTPNGDGKEYSFMTYNLSNLDEQIRFSDFLVDCCDDTVDEYECPDNWDPTDWRNLTTFTCREMEE